MQKKIVMYLLLVSMTLGLASGCGNAAESGPENVNTSAEEE